MSIFCKFLGHKIVKQDYTRLMFMRKSGGNWRLYKQKLKYTQCKRCGLVIEGKEVGKIKPFTQCTDKAIEVVRQ